MARRTRVAMRVVGLVVVSLVAVASLLLTSVTIWLHTTPGKRWIERALARQASERLGLTLTVGRISGSLFRDLRLDEVVLRDPEGRLVARADTVSARYDLLRVVRQREVDEIDVVRPEIVRPRAFSPKRAATGGAPARFSLRKLAITDGALHWRGHLLRPISATAAIDGTHARVSAALDGDGFAARGRAEWHRENRTLSARLDALAVEPSMLGTNAAWAGRGALHAEGSVAGPLEALQLALRAHTDDRRFVVGAQVDVEERAGKLHVEMTAPGRRARMSARAALVGERLVVSALEAHSGASRLTSSGHVGARGLDLRFAARVAPAEAALIHIHPTGPIDLRGDLRGPARSIDVRLAGRLLAARVALTGRIDVLARHGQLRFVARDIRPAQIVRHAPPLAFSGAFVFDGGLRAHSLAGRLSVDGGSLRLPRVRFDRLRGTSQIELARVGSAQVEELSGWMHTGRPRPIAVRTLIRWDREAIRCDVPRAVVAESEAAGEVLYTHDRRKRQPLVIIQARELSISPSQLDEFLHHRPAQPWRGDATFVWAPQQGYGLGFSLATEQGPATGVLHLRRARGGLELADVAIDSGGSRLRGVARLRGDRIVASLDELLLQPRLVHALWPVANPSRPVRIQGAFAGPRQGLTVRLVATSGPSTLLAAGRVNLYVRSFQLLGAVDTLEAKAITQSQTPGRLTLELSLGGHLVDGGIAGTLTVRHARGRLGKSGTRLYRGRLDARLDGPRFHVDQALLDLPGVVVEAKGGGSWRDFHLWYGVVVTDARELKTMPATARVLIGITHFVPGNAVEGSVRRRGGGKIEITKIIIPTPFRFLGLVYRLLKGEVPKLTVH